MDYSQPTHNLYFLLEGEIICFPGEILSVWSTTFKDMFSSSLGGDAREGLSDAVPIRLDQVTKQQFAHMLDFITGKLFHLEQEVLNVNALLDLLRMSDKYDIPYGVNFAQNHLRDHPGFVDPLLRLRVGLECRVAEFFLDGLIEVLDLREQAFTPTIPYIPTVLHEGLHAAQCQIRQHQRTFVSRHKNLRFDRPRECWSSMCSGDRAWPDYWWDKVLHKFVQCDALPGRAIFFAALSERPLLVCNICFTAWMSEVQKLIIAEEKILFGAALNISKDIVGFSEKSIREAYGLTEEWTATQTPFRLLEKFSAFYPYPY